MEQIDLWQATPEWLELVFNVLLLIIPALAAVAITTASGATVVATVQKSWKLIRPAIDEPTDPLILLLASRIGWTPEQVSAWLLENFGKVVGTLPVMPDGTRQETAQQVNITVNDPQAIGMSAGVVDAADIAEQVARHTSQYTRRAGD